MLDKLLSQPIEFIGVCFGVLILLYASNKFAPHPFEFIKDILKILLDEFRRSNKDKSSLERLNAVMVVILLLLSIIFFFFDKSVSLLNNYFGTGTSNELPVLTIVTTLLLFLTLFISPTWVYMLKRQQYIDDIAQQAMLEKT